MTGPGIRRRSLAILAPTLGLLVGVMAAAGRGHPPRVSEAQDAGKAAEAKGPTPQWAGTGQCEQCHRQSSNTRNQLTDFVTLNEVDIWSNKDKHSDAFASLKSPLGDRMAARLHYDVTKEAACLNCHAPAFGSADVEPIMIEEGVSCVACHGAYKEWAEAHGGYGRRKDQDVWVRRSPQDKHDNFGMNDLRDPAVRAETCASCHVGSQARHRVVSHDMYAAGHPPLPGIEVATFSQGEPPHWWPMKDVPYFKKPENAGLRARYGIDQSATQFAKLVAVGSVVSFREAMNLFADTDHPGGVPDFARFDCASCHHELRVSDQSTRQAAGYGAYPPGRPPASKWPTALLEVAIAGGDPAQAEARRQSLSNGLNAFHRALGNRPFGTSPDAVQSARKLVAWSEALIADLNVTRLDSDASLRMLRQIAAMEPPDHASARQLAWGFQAIYQELASRPANDKEIQDVLNALIGRLKIALKPGDKKSINRDLGARLDAGEMYDPAQVRQDLQKLGRLLPR